MILTQENLYIKFNKNNFVVCIDMPDNSRNYLHSQELYLGECMSIRDEIRDFDINDLELSLEADGSYFRIQIVIPNKELSHHEHVVFHSRKLNLNDAITERDLLLA